MAGAVPESLLKKRQRDEAWATAKASAAAAAKVKAKANRKVIFKRAESYVKEYRSQVRHLRQQHVHTLQMLSCVQRK